MADSKPAGNVQLIKMYVDDEMHAVINAVLDSKRYIKGDDPSGDGHIKSKCLDKPFCDFLLRWRLRNRIVINVHFFQRPLLYRKMRILMDIGGKRFFFFQCFAIQQQSTDLNRHMGIRVRPAGLDIHNHEVFREDEHRRLLTVYQFLSVSAITLTVENRTCYFGAIVPGGNKSKHHLTPSDLMGFPTSTTKEVAMTTNGNVEEERLRECWIPRLPQNVRTNATLANELVHFCIKKRITPDDILEHIPTGSIQNPKAWSAFLVFWRDCSFRPKEVLSAWDVDEALEPYLTSLEAKIGEMAKRRGKTHAEVVESWRRSKTNSIIRFLDDDESAYFMDAATV